MSGAIPISAEFFGLASQDWPSVGSPPTFPFGRISNFDNSRTHWRSLHTANNTINWAALDTFVTGAKAVGVVKGIYCLYGCPTFLASTGASVAGPYGGLGEIAYPNNLAQLTYFCEQFALRNISTYNRFFDCVSLFNEPGSVFWGGTMPQFVDTLWTGFEALKGTDSSLTILTPGTFDLSNITGSLFNGIGAWLTVFGSINSTKRGIDCFEAIGSHPYRAFPDGKAFSGAGSILSLQQGGILNFRKVLKQAGHPQAETMPFYVTEYGVSSATDAQLTAYLAQSPLYREYFIQCLWIDAMLAGVKSMTPWSFDNISNLMGNLKTDDPGVVSGLRKLYNACVGKSIVAPSGVTSSGGRLLTFSDNTIYSVEAS